MDNLLLLIASLLIIVWLLTGFRRRDPTPTVIYVPAYPSANSSGGNGCLKLAMLAGIFILVVNFFNDSPSPSLPSTSPPIWATVWSVLSSWWCLAAISILVVLGILSRMSGVFRVWTFICGVSMVFGYITEDSLGRAL